MLQSCGGKQPDQTTRFDWRRLPSRPSATRSGVTLKAVFRFPPNTLNGKPALSVTIPLVCQPPSSALEMPLAAFEERDVIHKVDHRPMGDHRNP